MVRIHLALGLVIVALISACGGQSTPTSTATPASTSTVTATPEATPTTIPTLQPVDPPELKLRLVNVATGANSDLPVAFGQSRAWSPDSKRIAVAGGQDAGLSVGDLTGQPFRQLWPGACVGADWSPTQDQIAAACKDGVIILGTDGKVIARDESVSAEWVHWSPDGKVLAYGSYTGDIGLMKVDGSRKTIAGWFMSAQWLTDGRLATVEQPDYRWAATIRIHDPAKDYAVAAEVVTRASAYALAINLQGQYAAYSVFGPAVSGSRILTSTFYVIELSSGRELESFPAYASYLAAGNGPASFSADGRMVLMQSDFCKPGWSLAVAGVDGSVRTIAQGSFTVTKFSPDGLQVAFTAGTQLWVGASDGSTPARRLATGVHGPAGFEWSPDGKWISVPPYFGGFGQCEGA